jgi:hypothetical protein
MISAMKPRNAHVNGGQWMSYKSNNKKVKAVGSLTPTAFTIINFNIEQTVLSN